MTSLRPPRSLLAGTLALFSVFFFWPGVVTAQVDRDFRLGKGLYDQGFFSRAVGPLERVLTGDASPAQREETLFLLGEAYRAEGETAKAAERFGTLLSGFPRSTWRRLAQLGRGECLVREGRFDDAIDELETLLEDPEEQQSAALYWLAEARSRRGDQDEAVRVYGRLLEAAPRDPLAPYAAHNAGLILREADRFREGLDLLDRVAVADVPAGMRDRLWLLRGDLALGAGEPERAIADYSRVEGTELSRPALAGVCWAARDISDESIFSAARESLKSLFPRSDEAREADVLWGAWRAELGDVAAADAALDAHRSGPRGTEAQFWRAWARARAGRHAEAAAEYTRIAGGTDRWSRDAAYRLEGEHRKAEDWDAARRAAEAFLRGGSEDPRRPDVLAGAVESAYRLGLDDDVLELEQRFSASHPDHALRVPVLRFAAEAALRSGELQEAVTRFRTLWEDASAETRVDLGPRYAWALYQQSPRAAADVIAAVLSDVPPASPGGASAAAEVGVLLGRARYAAGEAEAALAAFRAASIAGAASEVGARARLEIAILQAERGEMAEAEEVYRSVLEGRADPAVQGRALIDLAELRAGQDDFETAIPLYERYLAEHPAGEFAAAAHVGIAFTRWRSGAADEALDAIADLRRLGGSPETLAEVLYLEGRVLQDREDASGARQAFERYLREFPGAPREPEVLRELARVDESAGRPALAIRHLERLVLDHPDSPGVDEALYRLAWLQGETGNTAASADGFARLIERFPNSAYRGDAHYRQGDAAYEAGRYAESRAHYEAARSSADAARLGDRAQYRIAWSHAREESWPEAQVAFAALAERYPDSELAGESLFLAADASGRIPDAGAERALLERFVRDHTRHEFNPEARIRLAEILTESEDCLRIHELLDVLRNEDLPPELRFRHRVALGRALVGLGSPRAAISLFEEAIDEGQTVAAEAQFELGLAHRAIGDRARAIDAFIHGTVLYNYKPWKIRSYVEAGRDLIATGKSAQARRLLELALELDAEGAWSEEARELLAKAGSEESR